jgi:hypothetical protein
MPRIAVPVLSRPVSRRLVISCLVLILLFLFTPISKALLRGVDGSFAPTSFSSLALRNPSAASAGVLSGDSIRVKLTNHSGHVETYHWSATQKGGLISLGEETLVNGRSANISIPSRGAVTGTLKISLTGTKVFVTVPVVGT